MHEETPLIGLKANIRLYINELVCVIYLIYATVKFWVLGIGNWGQEVLKGEMVLDRRYDEWLC